MEGIRGVTPDAYTAADQESHESCWQGDARPSSWHSTSEAWSTDKQSSGKAWPASRQDAGATRPTCRKGPGTAQ